MASILMDRNFSAEHQGMKNPWDNVRLADGHGFMVTDKPYKEHLKTAVQFRQVGWCSIGLATLCLTLYHPLQKLECHEHRAVLAATSERTTLEATGIGAAACTRHGFFFPHCVVDFQKGEQ